MLKENCLEDLYDLAVYDKHLADKYGIIIAKSFRKRKGKWSIKIKEVFDEHGKLLPSKMMKNIKNEIAKIAAKKKELPINQAKMHSLEALKNALSEKLKNI